MDGQPQQKLSTDCFSKQSMNGDGQTPADDEPGTSESENDEQSWRQFFPYESAYQQQEDGIERAIEQFVKGGYLISEGACGTGKTLLAVSAALDVIRNRGEEREGVPEASRLFAVTPVKQQLAQFETEFSKINTHLQSEGETPAKTLFMRGKADLIPYARTQVGPFATDPAEAHAAGADATTQASLDTDNGTDDAEQHQELSTNDSADAIRERTANIIKRGSTFSLNEPPGVELSKSVDDVDSEGVETWFDRDRAKALVETVKRMDGKRLSTAGANAPYPTHPPRAQDVFDADKSGFQQVPSKFQGMIDPFYAAAFIERSPAVSFEDADDYVLDSETLVRESVAEGVCPHEMLKDLMLEAEAIVGNYYHLFDPQTQLLTNKIIDEETLAIVDEAHMVEDRTRDALSEKVSVYDLRRAFKDVIFLRDLIDPNKDLGATEDEKGRSPRRQVNLCLDSLDIVLNEEDLETVRTYLQWVMAQIDREVEDYLDETYDDWERAISDRSVSIEDYEPEIPLQQPGRDSPDRLSQAFIASDHTEAVFRLLEKVAQAMPTIFDQVAGVDRDPIFPTVSDVLSRWWSEPNVEYFREIEMEYRFLDQEADASLPNWTKGFNASLHLYNCLPSDRLSMIFEDLGGGMLMSATLEPFDVYQRVCGLGLLAGDAGEKTGPETDALRSVETAQYGLMFPEENRASWIVDAPAYTSRNRGPRKTDPEQMTETRKTYLDVMETVANSRGNILLCMPSYKEATWAGEVLEDRVGKDITVDESSSAEETTAMLDSFFDEDADSVLITSTLGTVTEGVDYKGSRLHTVAVVGVPYSYIDDKQEATEAAYEYRFEDIDLDGFTAAQKIPAVRKSRQALGRVIRGEEEYGTRLLIDERYGPGGKRHVNNLLSSQEREEFRTIDPGQVHFGLDTFWSQRAPSDY